MPANHTADWTWREMDNDKMVPSIRIFTKSKSGKDMCIGRLDTKEYVERACHAVNCHEGLVEALGFYVLVMETTKDGSRLREAAMQRAQAALAKAKAKG